MSIVVRAANITAAAGNGRLGAILHLHAAAEVGVEMLVEHVQRYLDDEHDLTAVSVAGRLADRVIDVEASGAEPDLLAALHDFVDALRRAMVTAPEVAR